MNYTEFDFQHLTNQELNFLKNDIILRDEAFKGGLKMYDKMIMDLGKVSAGLKDAKRMVIGLGIAVGAVEVLDAYGTGDKELGKKVLLAESAKFAGGLLGGFSWSSLQV